MKNPDSSLSRAEDVSSGDVLSSDVIGISDFVVVDAEFEVEDLLEFVGEEQALDIIRMRYRHEEGEVKTSDIEERLLRSKLSERLRRILKRKLKAVRENLTRGALERIVERAEREYENAKIEPNEAVGILAAQSIGEPGTQMSLPRDERILVIENGMMRSVRIGDLVDAYLSKHGADGSVVEMCDVRGDDLFVLSLDENGKLRWKRVKYCIRHEFNGELLRLRTRSGREITATPFHSFVTKRDGRIIPIAGSMLKPGDRIPVIRRLPMPIASEEDASANAPVPRSIEAEKPSLLMNEEIIAKFLRGFFASIASSADGAAASDAAASEGRGVLEVRFRDKHEMDDFALLLARVGIFSFKRKRERRDERKSESRHSDDYLLLIPRSSVMALLFGARDRDGCEGEEQHECTAHDEDVVWDEIERVERVRRAGHVYDISVDGLETFATHDGIITHNTMRTFHYAGVGALYVTMGLPRIMEIMDARKKPSTPTMKIKLLGEYARSREKAEEIAAEIEETRIKDVARIDTSLDERCVLVMLKEEKLAERRIQRDDIEEKMRKMDVEMERIGEDILKIYPKEESYYELLRLEERISNTLIKGIEGIKRVLVRKDEDGEYTLFTEGSALKKVMRIDGVDPTRTTTSNIIEIADVLGIEAARNAIIEEIMSTLEDQNLDVDPRHISLIADAMTMDGEVKQIGRHGLAGEKASVLSRAAFEVTVEHLLEAALRGERDELLGITENVIVGQPIRLGTGAVELVARIPMNAGKAGSSSEDVAGAEEERTDEGNETGDEEP